jgi:hypothetical protein
MITIFICNEPECSNTGIEYRMIEANPTAMCGGCKQNLIGTIEQEAENNG